MTKFLSIYGNEVTGGEALLISLVSIILVFVILIFIVLIISLMQKIFFNKKKDITTEQNEEDEVYDTYSEKPQTQANVEIVDEDMMVAALIATIDYANETKKDVRLVSIKQIG